VSRVRWFLWDSHGYGFFTCDSGQIVAGDGLFRRLKKAVLEHALAAELTHHLGYDKGDPAGTVGQ